MTHHPGFRRGVFANNYVNLETVKAVGFDYDYTLVHYNVRTTGQTA